MEFEDWFYDNPEDLWDYYCLYEEEPLPIQQDDNYYVESDDRATKLASSDSFDTTTLYKSKGTYYLRNRDGIVELPFDANSDEDAIDKFSHRYKMNYSKRNGKKKVSEEYIKAPYEDEAKRFCTAIEKLANNKDALENFESYIAHHFQAWLDKWASTPEDIIYDFEWFSRI